MALSLHFFKYGRTPGGNQPSWLVTAQAFESWLIRADWVFKEGGLKMQALEWSLQAEGE